MDHVNKAIDAVKPPKAYLVIVEKIIRLVASGELKYGEYLYTEKDLMEKLGVSRPTLREALRVLEFLGIISVSPRRGISVNFPDDSNYYLSLSYILMFDKTSNIEIFHMRRAIQIEMVSVAATVATQEELDHLKVLLDEMERNWDADYMTFEKLDYDFHMHIVVCAHSMLSLKLMQTMSFMIHSQMQERLSWMPLEDRKKSLQFHKDICAALLARDGIAAKRHMEAHLSDVYLSLKSKPVQFTFDGLLNK